MKELWRGSMLNSDILFLISIDIRNYITRHFAILTSELLKRGASIH